MSEARGPSGARFWIACAVGWGTIAFGIAGLLGRLGVRSTLDVGLWVVGGNVLHDAIVAPVVFATGAGLATLVRRPWRMPLAAGLAASAVIVAVAYPALRGFGRKPRNPSVLPLDYGLAVATVIATVWLIVVIWVIALFIRRGSGESDGSI